MVKLYNEDSSFIGYVNKEDAEFFCYEHPSCWFEKTTDFILTEQDIDIIIDMLDAIEDEWGLNAKEFELKGKIKRWVTENGK